MSKPDMNSTGLRKEGRKERREGGWEGGNYRMPINIESPIINKILIKSSRVIKEYIMTKGMHC